MTIFAQSAAPQNSWEILGLYRLNPLIQQAALSPRTWVKRKENGLHNGLSAKFFFWLDASLRIRTPSS